MYKYKPERTRHCILYSAIKVCASKRALLLRAREKSCSSTGNDTVLRLTCARQGVLCIYVSKIRADPTLQFILGDRSMCIQTRSPVESARKIVLRPVGEAQRQPTILRFGCLCPYKIRIFFRKVASATIPNCDFWVQYER